MPRNGRLALVPDGARIVENPEMPVMVIDGVVDHAVSAQWVDLVFIPTPQVDAVAHYKTFIQGRASGNQAPRESVAQHVLAVGELVARAPGMRGVDEVAIQNSGGRAQAVACVQVLLVVRTLEAPMIAQSSNQGVGGLGVRGRILFSKSLETGPHLEGQRL